MKAFVSRRQFAGSAGLLGLGAAAGLLQGMPAAWAQDYRALIVIDLAGGNDGHNLLIPTDGAYADYERARTSVLALPKDSLIALDGVSAGHRFAVHPAMKHLARLYNEERLSFIGNVGALIEPATAEKVLNHQVRLPVGLLSHSDQAGFVQGAFEDTSGWAGRALESLDAALRHPSAAVAVGGNRTLVQGRFSPVSMALSRGNAWWGKSQLTNDNSYLTESLKRMARWQFTNDYERIYTDTLKRSIDDAVMFAKAVDKTQPPQADFGSGWFADQLKFVAQVLPVMPSFGMKRQVFFLTHGGFDTHANQRGTGSGSPTQDELLAQLDAALGGLDHSLRASRMDEQSLVLVMTEFGRTLRPGSGGGSEHAWGTHWILMGPKAIGKTVHGRFPDLIPGGPDDGDVDKNGRFVPDISADQVGASLMQWMGLSQEQFLSVFPNLKNFPKHTLPMLRS